MLRPLDRALAFVVPVGEPRVIQNLPTLSRDAQAQIGILVVSIDELLVEAADALEAAIARVLDNGPRTKDIAAPGQAVVATAQMGDAILAEFQRFQS